MLLAVGLFLMWHIPLLEHCDPSDKLAQKGRARVSVIIPARNEAQRLKPLLESLGHQTYYPYEVVLVDDRSVDDTALLAKEAGARTVLVKRVPKGWHGKAWACWQGANHSDGDVLVFLDADTWLAKDALENIVRAYHTKGGLLTVQPYHVIHKPYEQLSAIFNIVLMAGLNAFTPLGDRLKPSGAFGPCIVCSRDDYFRIEGHSAVKAEVLEDVALAKAFSKSGLSVSCYGGRGEIYFQMYPGGIRELMEGWSKGLALGARAIRITFSVLVGAWVYGCLDVFLNLTRFVSTSGLTRAWPWFVLYGLYVWEINWMLQRIGCFRWWTSVLYPIPLIFFTAVMLYSLLITYIMGQVTWKGRTIHVHRGDDLDHV